MSFIDYQLDIFFGRMDSIRWDIAEYEMWMEDYKAKRETYPAWKTQDGKSIWVYELEDGHLDNLIPFIQKRDPENKTHWLDLFKAEKLYRVLPQKITGLKKELEEMERVAELL